MDPIKELKKLMDERQSKVYTLEVRMAMKEDPTLWQDPETKLWFKISTYREKAVVYAHNALGDSFGRWLDPLEWAPLVGIKARKGVRNYIKHMGGAQEVFDLRDEKINARVDNHS